MTITTDQVDKMLESEGGKNMRRETLICNICGRRITSVMGFVKQAMARHEVACQRKRDAEKPAK